MILAGALGIHVGGGEVIYVRWGESTAPPSLTFDPRLLLPNEPWSVVGFVAYHTAYSTIVTPPSEGIESAVRIVAGLPP
jgi:hypothetical protein